MIENYYNEKCIGLYIDLSTIYKIRQVGIYSDCITVLNRLYYLNSIQITNWNIIFILDFDTPPDIADMTADFRDQMSKICTGSVAIIYTDKGNKIPLNIDYIF